MPFGVNSEVGRLRRVMVHRPGLEHTRLTPSNAGELLFDDVIMNNAITASPELTIPHRAMHQRRFVLEPLAEIAPELLHPVFKKTVRELRDALPEGQAVRKQKT